MNGNATKAAKEAGYNCKSYEAFGVIGHENLKKLNIPIMEIMDLQGITDAKLIDTLKSGLHAEKTEVGKYKGCIVDEKSYADWITRKRYLELALKLKNLLRKKVNVTYRRLPDYDGDPEKAEEYVRELLSRNGNR